MFIDEAGFNMHIKRTFGRSVSGTLAKTTVPMQRGVSITILGAMCEREIISLLLKKPTAVATKKKRKLDIYTNIEVNSRIGTRAQHYLNFLSHTMDVLDSQSMQGRYLIMDNAPIHKADEEMWSKIKFGVHREEITESGGLILRITESAKTVTLLDCLGWINHAISFFPCCLNRERKL
ncbi:hypothetical protein PHYBLDRAFT_142990 [Phycomyces blakesleeanus NRRL 1555(-)]|uniref:Tc1-like transposase DDE domain-containing protein n=1 Tax=Phycomyces blakesleeanus (strain ATCC 8743b / DSM 1359 / FGSC 10004 / NBRC 33097 / NRRL 1555) TaxID=763407 RepID=A0A167NIK2_PHYB8|nr:hypothetical protein PHYBLDRAFT_142990 [Phycomyces blakesleeanus NRRL 1555(-)]OAD76004.1 hypothetical protein PHYBLDRAFT_142990 [Phycomyces blakesleeanus NRRL 1555(-)]|eukprot:XP_018294044.1 hypothetical protein PHYBLDRAFT_142990 [Phycomyces blakesleeanus NRRL 1555(-)]